MNEFKSFKQTRQKGIDDLKSTYPYANAHDWPTWNPAFNDVTEESYKADVKGYEQRVRDWNENYITELKESGEYGKDYTTTFNFMRLPEFDSKPVDFGKPTLLIPKGTGEMPPDFNIKYDKGEF